MTRQRWLELLFGPLVLAVVGVPILLFLCFECGVPHPGEPMGVQEWFYLWVMPFVVLGGVISLWWIVLFGTEGIRHPWLRKIVAMVGILSILALLVVLLCEVFSVFIGYHRLPLLWILVGPLVVWLRYLPRLIRG